MESFDIVNLIEKNPITRMNKNYENKFIQKLKNIFTNDEQKLFLGSFYCFLNCNDNDFIIDFDNIWKWCRFSRKDHAKTLLEKHFTKNIDYKIFIDNISQNDTNSSVIQFASANAGANATEHNTKTDANLDNTDEIIENLELTDEYKKLDKLNKKTLMEMCRTLKIKISGSKDEIIKRIITNNNDKNAGGQNKEKIMLTITTFKKFCMKANTKKADEVHDYYIKLEKILQEIILEQSDELNKQLEFEISEKNKLNVELYKEQCLVVKQQKSLLYQQEKVTNSYKVSRSGCIYIVHDPLWKFTRFKIGKTEDFNERISTYRTSSVNMKVDFIMYTPHYELFEQCIKVKFCEYAEQPSHEMYIAELDILINSVKEINRACSFNGYEEKELWKLNLENLPTPENIIPEHTIIESKVNEKIINNYIMPIAMREDGNKKYIDIERPDPEDLKQFNPMSDIQRYDEISPSTFLPSRTLFSEYKMKNEKAPDGMRYCNSFCQDYCEIEKFKYKSQYLFTSCENCRIMEDLARYKIQNNIYTCDQIANNPTLVFLDTNQKLCPYCKEVKHESKFRPNRKQCRKCKDTKRTDKIKNIRQNIDDDLNEIKNKIKYIENLDEIVKILEKYNRDTLYSMCINLDIKRRSNDNKESMIQKLCEKLKQI